MEEAVRSPAPFAADERQCIVLSRQARARQLRSQAATLEHENRSSAFCNRALTRRYLRQLNPRQPKQALLALLALPFRAAFYLLGLVIAPFQMIHHRISVRPRVEAEMLALEAQAKALEADPGEVEVTGPKTLLNLWSQYGLDDARRYQMQVELLAAWLRLLYGPSVASAFDVADMVKQVGRRQGNTNRRYAAGEAVPHYRFKDPLTVVIGQISNSLPPYQKAGRGLSRDPVASASSQLVDRLRQLEVLWPRMDLMLQEGYMSFLSQAVDGWRSSRLGRHELLRWLYAFDAEFERRVTALAELLRDADAEEYRDEESLPFPPVPEDFLGFWLSSLDVGVRGQYCQQEIEAIQAEADCNVGSRLEALEDVVKRMRAVSAG